MLRFIKGARSAVAFLLLLVALGFGGLVQRLTLWPLSFVAPGLAGRGSGALMLFMGRLVIGLARLGGGRFRSTGQVPTAAPALIVMNHQSLFDVPAAALLCGANFPRFVARLRYRRVPMIGMALRLTHAPFVDPERDAAGAIEALRRAARAEDAALLIYPEGHRSRDGEIGELETAGLRAILGGRRLPVYLIVADGFWRCRSILDVVFGLHKVRGVARVSGPLQPPEKGDLKPFIAGLREGMIAELRDLRSRAE